MYVWGGGGLVQLRERATKHECSRKSYTAYVMGYFLKLFEDAGTYVRVTFSLGNR